MISGAEIPQADRLDRVRKLVGAVSRGARDTSALEAEAHLSRRHASYYREAARVLGWITGDDEPRLTPSGKALLETPLGSPAEASLMERSIKSSRFMRQLAPDLFEFVPPSRDTLAKRITKHSGLAPSTAMRRAQTLLAWRDRVVAHRASLFREAIATAHLGSTQLKRDMKKSTERTGPKRSEVLFLTSLRLVQFKNFVDATLPLGPLTLLTGTNASGKSNIRDAFRFLHGVSRGYTLAEIIGEKWIEGGVLQWRGLRGGIREATYQGREWFGLEASFQINDRGRTRSATYRIDVEVGRSGNNKPPRVKAERLVIEGRGQFVFDSHPETNAPPQDDPYHLTIRLRKEGRKGWVGPTIKVINNRPALSQLLDHPDVTLPAVREHTRLALAAFQSMRFLDLSPEAMKAPSLPGQTILSDRGENLSSVLQAICRDSSRKRALVEWVRELTPLDAKEFEFPADQTGKVLVTLVEEGDQKTSAYSASDGTLRFLAMIAALLGPEPARFYFFEELENGIHPTRLHLLLRLIERQATTGVLQVVATTHSPAMLTALSRDAQKSAVLVYRLPASAEATLKRIADIPGSAQLLKTQDLGKLLSSGWLEDAVLFTSKGAGGERSGNS